MNKIIIYTLATILILIGGFFALNSYIYHEKQGDGNNQATTTPIVGENLDGEADPSRMTLDMNKWEWVNALYSDGRTITPKTTATSTKRFSIWFSKDGTFTATTDCNSMGGSYTAKEGKMTFGDIFMTEMYCGGSQEQDFLKLLQNTVAYHFTGQGKLIFDLKYDSGTVTFR